MESLIAHLNLCISIFLFLFQTTNSQVDPLYFACQPKQCGNHTIKYPFYIEGEHDPRCGRRNFSISCHKNIPILRAPSNTFQIQRINYYSQFVHLLDTTIVNLQNGCFPKLKNMSLDTDSFYIDDRGRLDLYLFSNCSSYPKNLIEHKIGCEGENEHGNGTGFAVFKGQESLSYVRGICKEVVLAKAQMGDNDGIRDYFGALKRGIVVYLDDSCSSCEDTGGRCSEGGCLCPSGTISRLHSCRAVKI